MIPMGSIKLHDRNPRTITEAAFKRLCESIQRDPQFMEIRPIVVDKKGVIIGGNMRFRACQKLGMTELPDNWVIRATKLTPEQRKRFVLVDNAPDGMAGDWDDDILSADYGINELGELGFDMADFDEGEGKDAPAQMDRAEELNKTWKVKAGDLWAIGDHRLLCGDATNACDVSLLLGDRKPLLMVTDPPYGVEYDPAWRAEAGVNKNKGKMGKVANDDIADWSPAWALFHGDVAYVWHAPGPLQAVVLSSLECSGFKARSHIIWAKDRLVLSRGDYHWQHEPCWYAVRDGKHGLRNDDRKQTTLWEIPARDDSGHGHSTQKPLECMARPMRNHDAPEVYDPFLGSGTTMVAGENLGRKVYGLEISPAYCAVILQRMTDAFHDLQVRRIDPDQESNPAKSIRRKKK